MLFRSPKKRTEILEFMKLMGRTSHLQKEEYVDIVRDIQEEVDRRWNVLNAKHESELL